VIMAANDGERKAARPSASPAFLLDLAAVSAGRGRICLRRRGAGLLRCPARPLVVVLLIGIVLYIPSAIAFDAIRKAMWKHKHRAALSDWRYHSGRHHYDEQTQTWQLWDGSRCVTRHF
jgi:hypothetical protein